jgi:nucleotide-binding universal stress UspA family protein
MNRSILVPLDGSAFAEHALPVALPLARSSGARLHLVTVSTPLVEAFVEGLAFSTAELTDELTARHEAYLTSVAKRLRERGFEQIETRVVHGDVVPCLCELLGKEDHLVVMATHGRGALGRFWMGSVADEMVRRAPAPLLLVRPGEGPPDLGRELLPERVLLPLDGTPLSEKVLGPVVELLAGRGAEVVLMRAVRAIVPAGMVPDTATGRKEARHVLMQVQELQTRLRREAEEGLKAAAARLEARGLRVRTEVIVDDDPAKAILRQAEHGHADLIALETHGRHGLSRLLRGSVADKVVRGAHVPVLVQGPRSA